MQHNGTTPDCKCARCRSIAGGLSPEEATRQQLEWQAQCLAERGFYVHYVSDDATSPTRFNAHTHGMNLLNHLDFQLVIQLPPKVGHNILCSLAEMVKDGSRFEAGQLVENIIRTFPIKLIEATENDRKVLRIILPDPDGKLELDEINQQYSLQYQQLDGNEVKQPWTPYPKRRKSY